MTYYQRHRVEILRRMDAQRRALGRPIGRGGPGRGTGRKLKPVGARGMFVCANPACGVERARTRNSLTTRFCSPRCASIAKRVPRGGIVQTWRTCATCHEPFHPKLAKQFNCGATCALAWVKATRSNPLKSETVRARRRRACAKRRANGATVVVGRWRRICDRDNWVCWICREQIDPSLRAPQKSAGTADHFVPLSKGGSNDDGNLRAAHFSCNSRRGPGRILLHREAA